MAHSFPGTCPVCDGVMRVTEMRCASCGTALSGEFTICPFCRLGAEDALFIETFIRCRGNIKEVERELGISYPTVRSRLERVISALGYERKGVRRQEQLRREHQLEVLKRLEEGELDVEESIRLLKSGGGSDE